MTTKSVAKGGVTLNTSSKKSSIVTERNIKIAFWLVTSLFFLWGFSHGLLDVMNKNFQNHLGITKAVSGLLQAAYFGGYFVIAIPASMVATKFGYKGGIIMGLALYAIGALLIVPASNAQSFTLFLFVITRMPEGAAVTGEAPATTGAAEEGSGSYGELFKVRHFRLGVLAQLLYVAAQVGAGAFFINYSVEHWAGLSDSQAAYFFSVALIAFLVGRVVTTPFMKKVKGTTIFAASVVNIPNSTVKKASSLLIMSIVGGAFMPFFMGHVSDLFGTGAGYLLLLPCYLYVAWYGFKGSDPVK